MLQKVEETGEHVFYPRVLATSAKWTWVEASGQGTVYSSTVIRQRPEKGGDFCVALVELSEGPRVISRLVDIDPDEVRIGLPVTASVQMADWKWEDTPVIAFRPRGLEQANDE
ncbi:Putative nucleic-acid-binding rubredoxin-like Zn-ribbon domain-containing protein (plasmid) [Aminobacter aminovorans]|nr:Putative nucleic-acid-binding rubredoxin-like Zn-ribbon domain-containing protein [Aminobacter aminovorans]